jgi:hypothetical protein
MNFCATAIDTGEITQEIWNRIQNGRVESKKKICTRITVKNPALTALITSFVELAPLIMAVDARNAGNRIDQ